MQLLAHCIIYANMNPPTAYPAHLERSVHLPNGVELWVRPILPEDAAHITRELATADPETLQRRFFTPRPKLTPAQIRRLAEVDYDRRLALVAFVGNEPVAVARYEGLDTEEAEYAMVVAPAWRRLGIATMLGNMIGTAARDRGFKTLTALYLADNAAAASVLQRNGFEPGKAEDGVVRAIRPLAA